MRIEKAAVLGAGTMGAQIAAHLANARVPTLLLDIAPRELTKEDRAKGLTLERKFVIALLVPDSRLPKRQNPPRSSRLKPPRL